MMFKIFDKFQAGISMVVTQSDLQLKGVTLRIFTRLLLNTLIELITFCKKKKKTDLAKPLLMFQVTEPQLQNEIADSFNNYCSANDCPMKYVTSGTTVKRK